MYTRVTAICTPGFFLSLFSDLLEGPQECGFHGKNLDDDVRYEGHQLLLTGKPLHVLLGRGAGCEKADLLGHGHQLLLLFQCSFRFAEIRPEV
jgi:hypothetical protein